MTHMMKEKYDIGVIVGRFQVAELSEAHKTLIKTVRENHKQYIIVIGVSPTLGTKQNPLGYTARMKMIQQEFPDSIITHLMDVPTNEVWSKELDKIIRALCPIGSVCLYGGRDSFLQHYSGVYPTFEMSIIGNAQGTSIREEIGKKVCDTADFRKGVIFSCQNQYEKVFPTVDIAVTRKNGKSIEVLMARRKENSLLQFPGGFVDPKDLSLEQAAKRELGEEVDIESGDEFNYVGSSLIKDWRYNNTSEKIITTFFQTDYVFGSGRPIDEFHSSDWIKLNKENIELVKDNHQILFQKLLGFFKTRR